ncbi:hypothetical protein [Nitratireductor sp. GCM10026969]|uniref:hypothetical protein n=1 Tax=Nitratireductor sp. GCM10026969 TaxID=3252645 RepID=UPI00361C8B71
MAFRVGNPPPIGTGSWQAWNGFWHTGNINPLDKGGGAMTGPIVSQQVNDGNSSAFLSTGEFSVTVGANAPFIWRNFSGLMIVNRHDSGGLLWGLAAGGTSICWVVLATCAVVALPLLPPKMGTPGRTVRVLDHLASWDSDEEQCMMDYIHEVVVDNGDLGKLYKITETLLPGSTNEPRVLHVSTLDESEIPALVEMTINPPPTPPEPTVDDFRRPVQAHLDAKAQERQYDDAFTLATYITSTNAAWAEEAQAFVAWRDQVWGYALGELDKVTAGERAAPAVEGFIAELPALEWPS